MPAKFSVLALSTTPILFAALACGGNDDGGGGGITVVDASTGGTQSDAPAAANCFVEPMMSPTFGMDDQFAETAGSGASGSNAHTETWGARLNQDAMPDIIQVELYAGIAAFNGTDIMPKTIQLTGDEVNYRTCAACVRIFADATQQSSAAQYFATGGTMTLTSTEGTLQGTLTDVTLTKVTIAEDFTSTPVGDGCETKIVSATMSAPLMMGSAAAAEPIAREAGATARFVIRHRTY